MTSRRVANSDLLAAILDSLETNPDFLPDKAGSDERRMGKYSRKALLAKKPPRAGREWFLMLTRDRAPRYELSIASTTGTKVVGTFTGDSSTDWKPVFDLGDELARRAAPRLLSVCVEMELRDPDDGEDANTINVISESANMYEPNLADTGLVGLAPRSYLGPDIVELIGKKRIESLKLPKVWFETGGVRIDLVDKPWRARPEDLVKPWRTAMERLRESEVFSTIEGFFPTGVPIPKRGKRWS